MTVAIEGGFLVERPSQGGAVVRRARLVKGRPEGVKRDLSLTAEDGTKYATGWLYPPGIRQGRAVAWPAD